MVVCISVIKSRNIPLRRVALIQMLSAAHVQWCAQASQGEEVSLT